MPERPFTLCVVTKEDIREIIRNARTRLYYCLPGVDEETARLLVDAYQEIQGTVYVHIDPSQHWSLDCGYGTEEGIECLAKVEKAYIAEGWRLGLVIGDDVALIFSPTPESIDPPPKKEHEPNGLFLKGAEVEFLLAHLLGSGNREILRSRGGKEPEQASTLSAGTTPLIAGSPGIFCEKPKRNMSSPRTKRLMNLLRRTFKIVRFRHSLTIAEKRYTLSPKDLGFKTEDIDRHLRISFTLLTDEDRKEINKKLGQMDTFVKQSMRDGWIKSLHPYGYVVWYQDPSVLEESFQWLAANLENEVRDWIKQKYGEIKGRSDEKIKTFLLEDVFPRVHPIRTPKHHWMTDKQFQTAWVKEYAERFSFPTIKDVIGSLKIEYDLNDISEEMLNNKAFRILLESAFEIDLDRLLVIEES
jgi:hypothetical protein